MIDKKELEIKALERQIGANPESPLFAKLASLYLERGKAQKALEVCDEGLAHHPFYTTAHLVKGKALLTLEMISEARRELELVHGYQPLVESVKNLLTEIGPSPDELKTEKRTPISAQPQSVVSNSAPKSVKTKPPVARVAPEPAKPEPEEKKPISELVPASPPIETPDPVAEAVMPPVIVVKPPVVRPEPERVTPESEEAKPESELLPESSPINEPEPEPEVVASPPFEPDPVIPEVEEPPPVREEDQELEKQAIEELESEGAFGDLHTDEPIQIEESNELTPEAEKISAQAEDSIQGTPEIAGDQTTGADDPFGISGGESEAAVSEVKKNIDDPVRSFGEFSVRMLEELGGTEHTLTLDDYLASPDIETVVEPEMKVSEPQEPVAKEVEPQEPLTKEIETKKPEASEKKIEEPESRQPEKEAPAQKNEIEDIAEKLKSAKKITPVINLADKSASDTEEPRGATGFVTPTLAEIYAKQGWYDDAIRAYRQLSVSKPSEKDKYMKRIEELEAEKKRSG